MTRKNKHETQTADPDYHFSFSNDNKTLKFSVSNDGFRALRIQADAIREANLSGGLRNINEVFFVNCLELNSIKWPSELTHIGRFGVGGCINLTKLDLMALPELEELTIIDCPNLAEIIGISRTIKRIYIKGCPIKAIKLPKHTTLEIFNVSTTENKFDINLKKSPDLSFFHLGIPDASSDSSHAIQCNLSDCPNIETIIIKTYSAPLDFHCSTTDKLKNLYVESGSSSRTNNLPSPDHCDFFYVHISESEPVMSEINNFSDKLAELNERVTAFEASPFTFTESEDDIETVLQQRGQKREDSRRDMALIHIMGVPEQSFKLGRAVRNVQLRDNNLPTEMHRLSDIDELDILIPEIEMESKKLAELLEDTTLGAITIDGITKHTDSILIPANAIICNNDERHIRDWLDNTDEPRYNILLLTTNDLKNPEIKKLLTKFLSKPPTIMYHKKLYPLPGNFKILIIGTPVHAKGKSGSGLFNTQTMGRIALTPFKQQQLLNYVGYHLNKAGINLTEGNNESYQRLITHAFTRLNILSHTENSFNKLLRIINEFSENIDDSKNNKRRDTNEPESYMTPPDDNKDKKRRDTNEPERSEAPPDNDEDKKRRDTNEPELSESPPDNDKDKKRRDTNEPELSETPPDYDSDDDELGNFHDKKNVKAYLSGEKPIANIDDFDETISISDAPKLFKSGTNDLSNEEDDEELGDLRDLDNAVKSLSATTDSLLATPGQMPERDQALLDAARHLALKIGQLIATTNGALYGKRDDSLLKAAKDIADLIKKLENEAAKSTPHETNALYQACFKVLIDPVDNTHQRNAMIKELQAVFSEPMAPTKKTSDKPAPKFQSRQQVRDMLLAIRNLYIKSATKPGVFGSAFNIGLHKQRLDIVSDMLHALDNHRQINIEDLQRGLNELKKDRYIAEKLNAIDDLLKYYICLQPRVDSYKPDIK